MAVYHNEPARAAKVVFAEFRETHKENEEKFASRPSERGTRRRKTRRKRGRRRGREVEEEKEEEEKGVEEEEEETKEEAIKTEQTMLSTNTKYNQSFHGGPNARY